MCFNGLHVSSVLLDALSRQLKVPEVLCWLLIAAMTDGRDKYGPDQWAIAQDELARQLGGVHTRIVRRYCATLVDKGLLEVEHRRRADGKYLWSLMRVRLPPELAGDEPGQLRLPIAVGSYDPDVGPAVGSYDPDPERASTEQALNTAAVGSYDPQSDRSSNWIPILSSTPPCRAASGSYDPTETRSRVGNGPTEGGGKVPAAATRDPAFGNEPDDLALFATMWLDEQTRRLELEELTVALTHEERLENAAHLPDDVLEDLAPIDDPEWNRTTLGRAGLWGPKLEAEQRRRRLEAVAACPSRVVRCRTPSEAAAAQAELLGRVWKRDVPTLLAFLRVAMDAGIVREGPSGVPNGEHAYNAKHAVVTLARSRARVLANRTSAQRGALDACAK